MITSIKYGCLLLQWLSFIVTVLKDCLSYFGMMTIMNWSLNLNVTVVFITKLISIHAWHSPAICSVTRKKRMDAVAFHSEELNLLEVELVLT